MKKLLITVLVLFLVAAAAFAQQQRFRNGTLTATGTSYNAATSGSDGTITVAVTFRSNRITEIVVREYTDTSAFVNMVVRTMVPAIISAQGVNVDNVAGATVTANGLKEAVAAAMAQARR